MRPVFKKGVLSMGFRILVGCLLVGSFAFADSEVEGFCSGELTAAFRVLHAERAETQKNSFIQAFRNEVLKGLPLSVKGDPAEVLKTAVALPYDDYVTFVTGYFSALEAKANWGKGKSTLVGIMRSTIRAQVGTDARKKELEAEVDEDSIVPMSAYLKVMAAQPAASRNYYKNFIASACGGDALAPGGIAFPYNGRKVFAFCPGALLRASVAQNAWTETIQLDGLMFTAFHEMGHLLGADGASRFRPMHDGLVACLKRQQGNFSRAYEDEVLADFWGSVALVNALKERPGLSGDEAVDLVALNFVPFKNGDMFSPHHLPYGARQQQVLVEVCRHLRSQDLGKSDCRLDLSAP